MDGLSSSSIIALKLFTVSPDYSGLTVKSYYIGKSVFACKFFGCEQVIFGGS
jgi:hypothetical protein